MKVGKISLVENPTEYNAEKVQTRGYETYCDYHLIEYETCYHYGYDMGEGYEESGVECEYDYEYEEVCTDVWVDDDDDECPYCGSLACSGECQDPDGGSGDTYPTISESVKDIKNKLDIATSSKIGERKFTIKEGEIKGLALGVTNGKLEDVLYKNIPTEITINKGLTNIQLKLVLAHEYVHIILYEKSRVAGSAEKLKEQDEDLYNYITEKKDAQAAHHEYMGKYPNIMEEVLKDAFKGESDDFYKYGQWAGGGVHSKEFENLSKEEQKAVISYLWKNKL